MGFQANVLKVMIASPGDVATERILITQELYRWNDANAVSRSLLLQPVKWETHSSPQMGATPQDILNEHLLVDADIVVGLFGTRIGTATTDFISGSVEEIKKHIAANKLAMLYFSHIPVDPHSIDKNQWAGLQDFKNECKSGGLYAEYNSHEDLRTQFGHHLNIELNKPKYLWLTKPNVVVEPQDPELDMNEEQLLQATAADRHGQIVAMQDTGGFSVYTNDTTFGERSARSEAMWKRVLKRLTDFGYLEQISKNLYKLTEEGFSRADKSISGAPL